MSMWALNPPDGYDPDMPRTHSAIIRERNQRLPKPTALFYAVLTLTGCACLALVVVGLVVAA
ncbi:uncharacterized protein AMSG_11613 [Thecamonas trahens ATCC 50062]|uniref:Uncharacterized protein n=1 Tax=Thecamonas trahens ATCC 50062 TaxID=461836 RepID=A0A0L0DE69_THETB|nr:hypothetical protein AMSG_11613 [Thecamonas trahens ATCC 50062]KNC50579.1 hypothetical protein AMSG_11613 [Thecamonas trahens ATCC 50062]|eukprot:XP_013762592.1 hypothetical protein AMSG_11613 [Thecamonas trahens ATCC 50062]